MFDGLRVGPRQRDLETKTEERLKEWDGKDRAKSGKNETRTGVETEGCMSSY
jgi:hypothetical protein